MPRNSPFLCEKPHNGGAVAGGATSSQDLPFADGPWQRQNDLKMSEFLIFCLKELILSLV